MKIKDLKLNPTEIVDIREDGDILFTGYFLNIKYLIGDFVVENIDGTTIDITIVEDIRIGKAKYFIDEIESIKDSISLEENVVCVGYRYLFPTNKFLSIEFLWFHFMETDSYIFFLDIYFKDQHICLSSIFQRELTFQIVRLIDAATEVKKCRFNKMSHTLEIYL